MSLISDKDKKAIEEMFSTMTNQVTIAYFTGEACNYCKETEEILSEVSQLNNNIVFKVYDFDKEKDKALHYGVDKIPATVLLGEKETDYGIKFYGIPSGYEFGSLIEGIVMVSKKETGLSDSTKEKLKDVTKESHIQVFVTPT